MNELDREESLLWQLRREMLDLSANDSKNVWINQGINQGIRKCVSVVAKHLEEVRKEKDYLAFIRDNEELFRELYDGVKDK